MGMLWGIVGCYNPFVDLVIDELSEKAVKEIRKEKIRREWKEKRQKEIQQREQRQKEYDDVYSDVI